MDYLSILSTVTQIALIILGIYVTYKIKIGEKVNSVLLAIDTAYQKVRKLDLLGDISKDDRLNKGLSLVEDIIYGDKKMDMTTEIKKLATKKFAELHTKDKNAELLMNAVAVENPKKKE